MDRSATAGDECRSEIAPVTDSFNSAPTCSWDAHIVFRIFRANQIPTARKATCTRRFPSAYQLLCIQAVNSFMASPWTGTGSIYNSSPAKGTGGKSRKRAGASTALAAYSPAVSSPRTRSQQIHVPRPSQDKRHRHLGHPQLRFRRRWVSSRRRRRRGPSGSG
jgi:hypothetical protein